MLPLHSASTSSSISIAEQHQHLSFCPTPRSLFNPDNNNNGTVFFAPMSESLNLRVFAMSDNSAFKMNLNEYLVTLEKPLGIRFALTADGKIIVHSLTKG
ncbi:hypothetical protein SESBI_44786, partial [Sesbania bispinosa]